MNIIHADAGKLPLADMSVDLVFGSPPYCDARTYGIGAQRDCREWVAWMLDVTTEAQRVCRCPVIWVAAGVTRDRNYWPACEGLMWEWWKRGGDFQLYRPCFFHRVGIPGSGGKDWFRADTEFVMCFKRPGPLPWSDNTAMGKPPKYKGGGCASSRIYDGSRRMGGRTADPDIANPGNVIHTNAGGGHTGPAFCLDGNEAPFPEKLAEWFIRSCCPPGGIVLDPFSGSGTTASVAIQTGRRFIACDIRESQCRLTHTRVKNVTPPLFVGAIA